MQLVSIALYSRFGTFIYLRILQSMALLSSTSSNAQKMDVLQIDKAFHYKYQCICYYLMCKRF